MVATRIASSFSAAVAENRHDLYVIAFMLTYVAAATALAARYDLSWPIFQVLGSYWVLAAIALFVLVPALTMLLVAGDRAETSRIGALFLVRGALFATFIPFLISFSQIKNVLRFLTGANFDAELAALDKALHFGWDAWTVYSPALRIMSFEDASVFYHGLWTAPLLIGPALAIALDRNLARRRAFVLVYLFVWVFLGNVVAALVYSVGPVFYGPLIGDAERYAYQAVENARLGIDDTMFAASVNFLLEQRLSGGTMTGSGISAFPSVHVAMATLTALYLGSLSRWLIPFVVVYVLIIQIFSVLSGLHYAVDGYFSVVAVLAFWFWVRRLTPSMLTR